jgi:hypothetical protein
MEMVGFVIARGSGMARRPVLSGLSWRREVVLGFFTRELAFFIDTRARARERERESFFPRLNPPFASDGHLASWSSVRRMTLCTVCVCGEGCERYLEEAIGVGALVEDWFRGWYIKTNE